MKSAKLASLESEQRPERAVLVGLCVEGQSPWEAKDSLEELSELARTAGAKVVGRESQRRKRPNPATLIGKGKALGLKEQVEELEADVVIFDNELSPAQQRNIEKLLEVRVLDRTGLILDIFAQHARTREAQVQTELAQLDYLLPRLTGRGVDLSRLGGGIGTRGPGEQKLEYDRRSIRDRITRLKRELESVRAHRLRIRKKRIQTLDASVALVGYTNAGKTSLLNALTRAEGYVADQLFATLDPRTRLLKLPTGLRVALSDTVGFIRNLPHGLVAAFRATLEEVMGADLLLLVTDASHPQLDQHIQAVWKVLSELDVLHKPIVTVLNKKDLVNDPATVSRLESRFENAVAVSAVKDRDFSPLYRQIELSLASQAQVEILIPHKDAAEAARIHELGGVVSESYEEDGVRLKVRMDERLTPWIRRYAVLNND